MVCGEGAEEEASGWPEADGKVRRDQVGWTVRSWSGQNVVAGSQG